MKAFEESLYFRALGIHRFGWSRHLDKHALLFTDRNDRSIDYLLIGSRRVSPEYKPLGAEPINFELLGIFQRFVQKLVRDIDRWLLTCI